MSLNDKIRRSNMPNFVHLVDLKLAIKELKEDLSSMEPMIVFIINNSINNIFGDELTQSESPTNTQDKPRSTKHDNHTDVNYPEPRKGCGKHFKRDTSLISCGRKRRDGGLELCEECSIKKRSAPKRWKI